MTVLLTFGTAMVLDGTLSYLFKNTQRITSPPYATDAIFIGDIFLPTAQLYSGLISIALIVGLGLFLKFSKLGIAIRATSLSRVNAELVGIDVKFVCIFSFVLGCALAGAAGSLVSFVFSFFPAKHWEWIAILMSLVVLGGMGSILGVVISRCNIICYGIIGWSIHCTRMVYNGFLCCTICDALGKTTWHVW